MACLSISFLGSISTWHPDIWATLLQRMLVQSRPESNKANSKKNMHETWIKLPKLKLFPWKHIGPNFDQSESEILWNVLISSKKQSLKSWPPYAWWCRGGTDQSPASWIWRQHQPLKKNPNLNFIVTFSTWILSSWIFSIQYLFTDPEKYMQEKRPMQKTEVDMKVYIIKMLLIWPDPEGFSHVQTSVLGWNYLQGNWTVYGSQRVSFR